MRPLFTGLVEAVGRVTRLEETEEGRRLTIEAPFASELAVGQSVSVDGACLTVTGLSHGGFDVTAVAATLERTVAGGYSEGTAVNLERAVRVGDRLDGHLVQGHVDGVAEFKGLRTDEAGRILTFQLPTAVARVTIPQGSVTLSGISLTVKEIRDEGTCDVAIIPHTWEHTNLSELEAGDLVNVEGDLIGKYVAQLLGPASGREERPGAT